MDISTILGLVLGIGAILLSLIMDGGSLASLFNVPAIMIVFGGTIGAALISFPISYIKGLPGVIKHAFLPGNSLDELSTIALMTKMAEKARREGLLSLEDEIQGIKDEYLRRGTQLVVDGTDPEMVRAIMEIDLLKMQHRHENSFGVLEAMAGYAPTMGIIGTVMGLIKVLGELSNPEGLGPAIAVAFVATFYGVFTANILWMPLASKLKKRSEAETLVRELVVEGLLSIQAGENPRIVQEKLLVFLSPSRRTKSGKQTDTETEAAA